MKVEIIEENKNEFKPIDVLFTIETKRELEFFISFLNSAESEFLDLANKHRAELGINKFTESPFSSSTYPMWVKLTKIYHKW